MSALAFSGGGLPFAELQGRPAAIPVPVVAAEFRIKPRIITQAMKRKPEFFGEGTHYRASGHEIGVLSTHFEYSFPRGGTVIMLTLRGLFGLAFATNNPIAFQMCLRMIDVLVRIATSGDPCMVAGARIGQKTQTAFLNSSVRMLEHHPVEKNPKPRKRAGAKVTCDLDESLHDWLLEFAASKGMTKAEVTRQIIRDRRALEESTTL